jgi:TatD DNase family protein
MNGFWPTYLIKLRVLESVKAERKEQFLLRFAHAHLDTKSSKKVVPPPVMELEVDPSITEVTPSAALDFEVSTSYSQSATASSSSVIPESLPEVHELPGPMEPLMAIDSHMHLDRTGLQMGGRVSLGATLDEILSFHQRIAPMSPVSLQGVVANYCDPERFPKCLPVDPRVRVAVGVHPKKVRLLTATREAKLLSLVRDPRVTAVGEIGFDLTEPADTWGPQLDFLRYFLPFCEVGKPLVLHIRNSPKSHLNPYFEVFKLMKDYFGHLKPFHLHCFGGTAEDVKVWHSHYRNCHFGFTGSVLEFNSAQLEGLKSVPLNRLLIETDSPYLSPLRGVKINTPAYIGDVGWHVAERRGVEFPKLMYWAHEGAKDLYGF